MSSSQQQAKQPSKSFDLKRKFEEPQKIVYSQPATTGTGKHISSNVSYAVTYLQQKGTTPTFEEIWEYLSPQGPEALGNKAVIEKLVQRNPKVIYDKKGANGKGTYTYKPIYSVKSADELLALLQAQKTASGISYRDLRDGWPDATEEVDRLEREGLILITRAKKDKPPRWLWLNDRTLNHDLDSEFRLLWGSIRLPDTQAELRDKLIAYGITPTSQVKAPEAKQQVKKKKAARRGGNTTNTHMLNLMKDYSHLRK